MSSNDALSLYFKASSSMNLCCKSDSKPDLSLWPKSLFITCLIFLSCPAKLSLLLSVLILRASFLVLRANSFLKVLLAFKWLL